MATIDAKDGGKVRVSGIFNLSQWGAGEKRGQLSGEEHAASSQFHRET